MSRVYAVVLLCRGDESNVNPVALKKTVPETYRVTVLNSKDLKFIEDLKEMFNDPKSVPEIKTSPVEMSIKYIGEKFKDTLVGSRKSLLDFISELSTCVTIAKWQHNDPSLLKALEILRSANPLYIDKKIRVEYGITDTVLQEILKIANRYV